MNMTLIWFKQHIMMKADETKQGVIHEKLVQDCVNDDTRCLGLFQNDAQFGD